MISGIRKIFSYKDRTNKGKDVILTGIPRSGTTLACKLLLEHENTIALNEPLAAELFKKGKPPLEVISNSFTSIRKELLKSRKAPVRAKDGKITDNAYSSGEKSRKRVLERSLVKFDKNLSPDFTLIMKHCAEFSLILPELTKQYDCYAIIRNPLSVIASWQSVNVPVSRGKVAKSKLFLTELHKTLESLDKLEEKQYHILNWYFSQFEKLPPENIISYEEIIASQGEVLSGITEQIRKSKNHLESRNDNPLYNKEKLTFIYKMLLKRGGNFESFYSKNELKLFAEELGLNAQ